MSVTKKDVQYIAKLARIEVTEHEEEKLTHELGAILDYIGKLNEVDTSGIEPTAQVTGLENVFRPDEAERPGDTLAAKLLDAMPQRVGKHLKVKSVFEKK